MNIKDVLTDAGWEYLHGPHWYVNYPNISTCCDIEGLITVEDYTIWLISQLNLVIDDTNDKNERSVASLSEAIYHIKDILDDILWDMFGDASINIDFIDKPHIIKDMDGDAIESRIQIVIQSKSSQKFKLACAKLDKTFFNWLGNSIDDVIDDFLDMEYSIEEL